MESDRNIEAHPTNHAWRGPADGGSFSEQLRQASAVSKWSDVLDLFHAVAEQAVPVGRKMVAAMGDTHSTDPEAIRDDLKRIGILNGSGDWENRYDLFFVQMGDTIDRGRFGRENYDLLGQLQKQSHGRLIRLLGNHDQFHLLGVPHWIHARPIPGLQDQLIQDVLAGNVTLAWNEGDVVYTHAGIDLGFFPEYRGVANITIVADLNFRLIDLVNRFDKGRKRYAGDEERLEALAAEALEKDKIFDTKRGVLWTRTNIENEQFRQVVGHTPQLEGITASPGRRVKYIDAGRVFAERGDVDVERGRAIMTNTVTAPGLRFLAAHPEVFEQHQPKKSDR